MKVFIGLPAPKSLIQLIAEFRKQYPQLPVKWLRDEDLHITIVPPWEEHSGENAKDRLMKLVPVPEIQLTFNQVSIGPDMRHARLIWATGEAPYDIIRFKRKAEDEYGKEIRKHFKLHITLARFDEGKKIPFNPQKVDWNITTESCALYHSMGNSRYKKLAEV